MGGRTSAAIHAPKTLAIAGHTGHIKMMNRRQFTLSIAALGLTPAIPVKAAPNVPPHFTPYMYGLGAHLARSSGLCSAEMLGRKLCLSPAAARAMHAQLLRQGIITAPSTAGVAVAAEPYMASIRFKTVAGVTKHVSRNWLRNHGNHGQAEDPDTSDIDPAQSS